MDKLLTYSEYLKKYNLNETELLLSVLKNEVHFLTSIIDLECIVGKPIFQVPITVEGQERLDIYRYALRASVSGVVKIPEKLCLPLLKYKKAKLDSFYVTSESHITSSSFVEEEHVNFLRYSDRTKLDIYLLPYQLQHIAPYRFHFSVNGSQKMEKFLCDTLNIEKSDIESLRDKFIGARKKINDTKLHKFYDFSLGSLIYSKLSDAKSSPFHHHPTRFDSTICYKQPLNKNDIRENSERERILAPFYKNMLDEINANTDYTASLKENVRGAYHHGINLSKKPAYEEVSLDDIFVISNQQAGYYFDIGKEKIEHQLNDGMESSENNFEDEGLDLMVCVEEVRQKFYLNANPQENDTWPKKSDVVSWIQDEWGLSENNAKSVQSIAAPAFAKKGGRKS